jgi:hypothetical protein
MLSKLAQWLQRGIQFVAGPQAPRQPTLADRLFGGFCLLAAGLYLLLVIWPIITAPPPDPLPADQPGDVVVGLKLAQRSLIFKRLAAHREHDSRRAQRAFAGKPWSIEDMRSENERRHAHDLARRYRVPIQTIYLILDEGIRRGWPGPQGQPLSARTPPLKPRRR